MKIIDYIMFDLTCEMPRALIKEGWQPYGSPYIDKNGHDCQAMVKYEEKEVFLAGMPCPPIKMDIEDQAFLNEVITENERLKESNEALELRLSELAKESYKVINKNQKLLHLITECSRCMSKASEL